MATVKLLSRILEFIHLDFIVIYLGHIDIYLLFKISNFRLILIYLIFKISVISKLFLIAIDLVNIDVYLIFVIVDLSLIMIDLLFKIIDYCYLFIFRYWNLVLLICSQLLNSLVEILNLILEVLLLVPHDFFFPCVKLTVDLFKFILPFFYPMLVFNIYFLSLTRRFNKSLSNHQRIMLVNLDEFN